MADLNQHPKRAQLWSEVWLSYRPYFVKIAVDFLIAVSLWVVLFLFKMLTKVLAIDGWAGQFIINMHAAGSVAAFGVFALLFFLDMYSLHNGKAHE